MNVESLFIVTAHAEFLEAAISEIRRVDRQVVVVETLAPGIALCDVEPRSAKQVMFALTRERPIFIRHLAPAQIVVHLDNNVEDIGEMGLALAKLAAFVELERGQRFAVQTRLVQNEDHPIKRAYSSGQANQQLAMAIAEETGAIESIKKPQTVVSILCTAEQAYIGISRVQENMSDWPGGARQFAQTPELISRAEFKLLEALEVFGLELPEEGWALDLGAAPGGWTRLLLEAGLHVIAVDPAELDPRLIQQSQLDHYRGYAERYLEEAVARGWHFDVIANDMRMDARDAARLLGRAAVCLRREGFGISVLKLPHATREIDPLMTLREALAILRKHYDYVQARQLFHNRQEVTVITAQPLARRL